MRYAVVLAGLASLVATAPIKMTEERALDHPMGKSWSSLVA